MSEGSVRTERHGAVLLVTLDRPGKLNAIDRPMIEGLHAAFDAAEADPRVRAVLLRGEGRAFSAGFDLDTGTGDVAFWREELRRDFDCIMRVWDCPKPTVAAVHGYCLGSAMELALACDLTLAADDARFGAPEVRYGSGIVCLLLPWVAGPKAAKALLMSGDDRVEAARALALGIADRLCAPGQLQEEALECARTLAANDAHAVRLTKQAIHRGLDIMGFREALLEGLEADARIEAHEDEEKRRFNAILAAEGVKAALAWRRSLQEEQP